jgi:hypothetical protein
VRQENVGDDDIASEEAANPAPGCAQIPAPPRIDADVEAIYELGDRIRHLWSNLTASSRDDLAIPLALLRAAADRRDTDSQTVREALQQVLLNVGTGALAPMTEATRRRLTALTGIALVGGGPPATRPGGAAPLF